MTSSPSAQPGVRPTMSVADWARLAALSVLWGGSFLFMRVLAPEVPPLTIVFGRVAIGAVALGVALAGLRQPLPRGRPIWLAFAGMGVLDNLVPFALLAWGERHVSAGLAAIVNATTPVFSILVAHWLGTDERLTPARLVGVGLGLAGVVVLLGPQALAGGGSEQGLAVWAVLACLLAALSYGFANIFGRRFRRLGLTTLAVSSGQLVATSAMSLPLMLLVDRPWSLPTPSPVAWAALAALGLLSTGLAYLIFFRLLASAGAVNTSLVTLLVPVSALLLGWLVLDEAPGPAALAGLGLIAAGLLAIDGRVASILSSKS